MIYYIFPVVILGTGACIVALSVDPAMIGEPAKSFNAAGNSARWYLCLPDSPALPNKLLGVLAMASVPLGYSLFRLLRT